MTWVVAAVTAASAIGSAVIGSNAAKKASAAQVQSTQDANAAQKEMFDKQVELQEPFRQAGITSQNRLLEYLGLGGDTAAPTYGKYARDFSMQDYTADPGYGFRFSEGLKALDRTAAARGGLLSGSTLKNAQRFGQDQASQEYQNAFNRYQINRTNQLAPLQSLMGAGQTSANTLTNAAGSYGNAAAENLTNAGSARASGYIGGANALSSAIGTGVSAFQNQNYLSQLLAANKSPAAAPKAPTNYNMPTG